MFNPKKYLNYDPNTGIFTSLRTGKTVGTINKDGYLQTTLDGKTYLMSRLAFMCMDVEVPTIAEHKDLNKLNNCWENLRPASYAQNAQNTKTLKRNTSGVKGVHWNEMEGKWQARVSACGVRHSCGYHSTLEGAKLAIKLKRETLHGEFTNHG